MATKTLKISVIIPVYNSQEIISECLRAIEQQSLPRDMYEIIVVDDASTDHTVEIVKSFEQVRCISISHGGPSAARNAGAREARGEIIAFTDSDCVPVSYWLEKITAPFEKPDVIGVKGVYRTIQKRLISRFVQLEYQYKYERMTRQSNIDFIDTYSAAYRREVFLANGGFDTAFVVPSVEDQELSFRLAQKGYLMVFSQTAEVYHRHDQYLADYWKRKYGIGYWKAYMLRWLPQKTFSDSHTSPSQRIQIGLLGLAILCLIPVAFIPNFLWLAAGLLILFFISGLSFWSYLLKHDPAVSFLFPAFILIRTMALGSGLFWGFLAPPQKDHHSKPSLSIDAFLLKRIIDIIGSIFGLIFSFPIILLAAIAIQLDTPGPVFFVQVRAGENGKPFRMIKLRTMVDGAEDQLDDVIEKNTLQGPAYKIQNDPRVTKVGRRLRRWSIDELPQFWNVFLGHMSLVGPRPEELWVVEQYNDEQRKRLAFKPGLTGPMQVNGRGNLDFDDRLKLEMDYMINFSVSKDFHILLKSISAVFNGKGAY
jgi:lipopolysaccharide/colanic/teichoic acid biosynthesis glycosyltransferase/glycosyltransferase involved in cell wall biosynthesis